MSVRRVRRRQQFVPHRSDEFGLDLQVSGFRFDTGDVVREFDRERKLVALEDREDWAQVTVEGTVGVPGSLLDEILPEAERADPPVQLVLVSRCQSTYLRKPRRIASGSEVVGTHQFSIEIHREDVRGSVELIPALSRTRSNGSGAPIDSGGFATFVGARLASDRSWQVRIDADEPPLGHHLEVRYESFSEDPALPPGDRVYFVNLNQPARPVLILNSDHESIQKVLNSEAPWGKQARIRDVFFDQISYSAWLHLLVNAGVSVNENGEARYKWQEGVLDRFVPKLYPGEEEASARIQFSQDIQSELPEMLERIDGEIQDRLELRIQMNKLVQEALEA